MARGVKVAVVGGACAVLVGGAGWGLYNIANALTGDGGTGSGGRPAVRTGPPSDAEVKETTEQFFAAWEKGDAAKAATYTNYPEAAQALLTAYSGDAHIAQVHITPGAATGTTVPFTVRATVSYDGKSQPLRYAGELTVVRGKSSYRPLVDWQPSVVHPQLKRGDTLATGDSAAPEIEALDRDGTVLTKDKYPSLGPVLDELRERYGDTTGGRSGVELVIRHADTADGEGPADTTLLTLAEGRPGRLRTTLSASAQAAAETAVRKYPESSVVAVKPSTGEILAVANHRDDGFNAAFLGELAPGSTMKIVSAATLIDNNLTSANGPAPCPPSAVWQSQTFQNLKSLQPDEHATLSDSFARSCNTAFVKFADEVKVDSLTEEAQNRFGLGQDTWKIGVPSFDGRVPASGGPDTAANLIGQGQVQLSPLNMASITATAMTGAFRQPVIVPLSLDHREPARARAVAEHGPAAARHDEPHRAQRHRGRRDGRPERRHRREDRLGGGRRAVEVQQLVHRLPGRRHRRRDGPGRRTRHRRGRTDCRKRATECGLRSPAQNGTLGWVPSLLRSVRGCGDPGESAEELRKWAREGASPSDGRPAPPYSAG